MKTLFLSLEGVKAFSLCIEMVHLCIYVRACVVVCEWEYSKCNMAI